MPAGRPTKKRPEPIDQDVEAEIARRRSIGIRLAAARQKQGWSLRDLANRARLAAGEVQRLEAGETDAKMSTLLQLAKALGCSERWLLLGEPSE